MEGKIHIFEHEKKLGTKLYIHFYNEKVVRFYYGKEMKKSITKAVILKPQNVETFQIENIIISKYFDIEITKDLLVKIKDRNGKTICEDNSLVFNKSIEEKNKILNLDEINKIIEEKEHYKSYAIEQRRKIPWETSFYGMGEKYGFINLINRYTENWNTDVLGFTTTHQSSQKAYHTSIPFYIGMDYKSSYGVFYDNSYKTYFDFQKNSEFLTFKADGGDLDYYFIYGEKIAEVVENYSKLTGTVKLPRKDFLGYQQCRWSYNDTEEVLQLANNMRKYDVPCDVIYLDIDYMQDYKVFTFDSKRFKGFKKMTEQLHKLGFKLVVIIDPGVKLEKNYSVYDEGMKNDYFIKDSNNNVYIGKVWPGDSVFPDFLNKEVRNWWGNLHETLVLLGVDGIWNDMNEPSDFSTNSKTLPDTTYQIDDEGNQRFHNETHNIYGHYESIATYNGLKRIQNTRPFVLTRAAYAGSQRYAALWTGDNSSLWEHMEMSIPMIINLGLSGYSYVGSDIGGFLDDGDQELFIRWIQLGIFYPLCRNHSTLNSIHQEPWSFGKNTLEIAKKFLNLRYALIDYLYNLFWESSQKGTPIMRGLFYHYQEDKNTHNINDQFLFGEDFLVAPILRPGSTTRLVYLPKGLWINYFTNETYIGEQHIIVNAELYELPLFVKEGAIIIINEPMCFVGEKEKKKSIHVYLGINNEKTIYFDDGITFAYKDNIYNVLKIKNYKNNITIQKITSNHFNENFDLILHRKDLIEKIENLKFHNDDIFNYTATI